MKTDHPERCRHKMCMLPRWISSAKVEVVRTLLADDPVSPPPLPLLSPLSPLSPLLIILPPQAMLLRETLGVGADGSEKAFPSVDVESMFKRIDQDSENTKILHTFTAVDPSGGGSSAFSVCTIVRLSNGYFQVSQAFGVPMMLPSHISIRIIQPITKSEGF